MDLQDHPTPRIPARYRLLARLGSGAIAEVWKAEVDGRIVALKVLHGGSARGVDLRKECRVLKELAHPNIVAVSAIDLQEDGTSFIEMEMVEGHSLSTLAARNGGTLSWNELKPLALQLCAALAYTHSKGLVHRDLKPSNLLVDQTGTLKLVDFGCAALTQQSNIELTRTIEGVASGTLPFMSPQQVNGRPAQPSDDLYAVGATLHALLAGAPPFSTGYLVHQVLNVRPPSIREHQAALKMFNPVSKGVAAIIAACLEKDESKRPQSAESLSVLLNQESMGTPDRRRFLIALAACGMVAAIGRGLSSCKKFRKPREIESGFLTLFDGSTLTGWRGDPKVWKVRDGAIVGRLDANRMPDASNWRKEFLELEGEIVEDFEFRLQVFLDIPEFDSGNLGVCYRTSNDLSPISYDLDFEPIWKYNCGLREIGGRDMLARPTQIVHYHGSSKDDPSDLKGHLIDEKRLKVIYRQGEWNDLWIRAVGSRLTHVLNGVTIVDFTDADEKWRRLAGGVSLKILLYYGPWVEARFRHLRIQKL